MPSIQWSVRCDATQWGESVAVIGSFNAWNKGQLVHLTTNPQSYPTWTVSHQVAAGNIEYKYVIAKDGGISRWEANSTTNRRLTVGDSDSRTKINDVFGQIPSANHQHRHSDNSSQQNAMIENRFLSNSHHNGNHEHQSFSNGQFNHLDAVQRALVKTTFERPSWRQRLQFVRSLFSESEFHDGARTLDGLVSISVYLTLLSTGQVRCGEDGGHHRPNHHAHEARLIDAALAQIVYDSSSSKYAAHVVRRILPHLPSYSSQFTVSVPLTRIRDIAHRGDIPKDLKLQIKHTLQNKLHRNAGPEDLYTSAAILERISHGGYSEPFVEQFRIFHGELRAFFNMSSLDDRLRYLNDAHRLPLAIQLLNMKLSNASSFDQLQKLVAVREDIAKLPFIEKANQASRQENTEQLPGEEVQKTRLADIDLESYAFVLLAALAKELEQPHNHESAASFPYPYATSILALAVRIIQQSVIQPEECNAIANELASCCEKGNVNRSKGNEDALRLRAAVERTTRFAREFSDAIVKVYSKQAPPLAKALGVDDRAFSVLPEAEVRSTVTFQTSRIAAALSSACRKRLDLPPWDTLHAGSVTADNVRYVSKLSDIPQQASHLKSVVVCGAADGDEDIPPGVVGVVNGRPLPHLSHLGVRARQAGVVFVSADDSSAFSKIWNNRISGPVRLTITVAQGLAQLERTSKKSNEQSLKERKEDKSPTVSKEHFQFDSKFAEVVDISKATRERVSAKASVAGELVRVAKKNFDLFDAVPGVTIPHGLFHKQRLLHASTYDVQVSSFHEAAAKGDKSEIEKKAENVRRFVLETFEPGKATISSIQEAFAVDDRVMVRSSANAEDLETLSGAGLYDTIADVPVGDAAKLGDAIRQVWASVWTNRAALSRRAFGVNDSDVSMAVLIQPMVRAQLSFVAFSHEPVSHGHDVYIEMAVGMGETLASAVADGSPYRFRVDREAWTVEDIALASYSKALFPGASSKKKAGDVNDGLAQQLVDYSAQRLTADRQWRHDLVRRIAKSVHCLEEAFDGPQDVEGCVTYESGSTDGARVYVVQARPQILN